MCVFQYEASDMFRGPSADGRVVLASLAFPALGPAGRAPGFTENMQRRRLWVAVRPTKTGRYIADTALWIYLVHLPLSNPGKSPCGQRVEKGEDAKLIWNAGASTIQRVSNCEFPKAGHTSDSS